MRYEQPLWEGVTAVGHTAGLGGPTDRHRRLFDVLEGVISLAFLCCALTAGTAFVIVVAVRAVAHVLHGG